MESQIKNFSSSASAIYMLKHRFITMRREAGVYVKKRLLNF